MVNIININSQYNAFNKKNNVKDITHSIDVQNNITQQLLLLQMHFGKSTKLHRLHLFLLLYNS